MSSYITKHGLPVISLDSLEAFKAILEKGDESEILETVLDRIEMEDPHLFGLIRELQRGRNEIERNNPDSNGSVYREGFLDGIVYMAALYLREAEANWMKEKYLGSQTRSRLPS